MRARRQHPRVRRPRGHGRPVLSPAACPACGRTHVRRSHTTDVFERLLALFFYYPFRCQACGKRFWGMQWGTRYARRPIDRRDFERLPVRVPVTIVGAQGRIDAVATDISLRGCALETVSRVPRTEPFALVLHVAELPIEIQSATARFAAGRVVGVEFRRLAPHAQARLVEYVAALFTARQV